MILSNTTLLIEICYFAQYIPWIMHMAYPPSYTGYFREPHWKSMGLPEISRVTLTGVIWLCQWRDPEIYGWVFHMKPQEKNVTTTNNTVRIHWNGKVVRMTALLVTGDVEVKLQRPQWRPGQSHWRPFRFFISIRCNAHDDVMTGKCFHFNWPFMRGIHRLRVKFSHLCLMR